MEELPGQKQGTWHIHFEGFCYNKDVRRRDRLQYICVKRTDHHIRCNAILCRSLRRVLTIRGEHNHAADALCQRKREMRRELQRLAGETHENANAIFNEVSAR